MGKNVADFDDADVARVAETLPRYGIHVSDIGSPIGKSSITDPAEREEARFARVLEIAARLDSPYIRLFSFYLPDHSPATYTAYRAEIVRRLARYADMAQARGIVLLHENEKEIYGDTAERCLDVLQGVGRANFQASFDPANFVQCGVQPLSDAWPILAPFVRHVQIKDAFFRDGRVVVAGAGEGEIGPLIATLYEQGYRGYLALEPHLSASGPFGGFSGPQLFHEAVAALKKVIADVEVAHGG